MKSNFSKLFNELFKKYRKQGAFCIDDLVDEIMLEIKFYDRPTKTDFIRWCIKARTETEVNTRECYSYQKNMFISLDAANLERLKDIDNNFIELIKSCQESEKKIVNKIKEREKNVGQMRLNPDGTIEEEKSITDLIGKVVGT